MVTYSHLVNKLCYHLVIHILLNIRFAQCCILSSLDRSGHRYGVDCCEACLQFDLSTTQSTSNQGNNQNGPCVDEKASGGVASPPELTCTHDYEQKNHLFCDSYGYDGNTYRYSTLASAKAACNRDSNCGGIKQWTCGAAQYGLCGKSGNTLRNYGSQRCVYVKN